MPSPFVLIISASLDPNGITVMALGTMISITEGYMFSSGSTLINLGARAAFSRQMYSELISELPCMVDMFRSSRG